MSPLLTFTWPETGVVLENEPSCMAAFKSNAICVLSCTSAALRAEKPAREY